MGGSSEESDERPNRPETNGVVAGLFPIYVKINLYKSSDPDEGDSLEFNVNRLTQPEPEAH